MEDFMGSDNRNNNFLVQGSILAAASILSRIIGLLYRVPLYNIIGDAGVGDYTNAFQIYNIALILSSYSLPLSVSKLVAERVGKKEYKNAYRVFLCAISFALVVGLIASLTIYFSADFLAVKIFNMPTSAIPLKVLAPNIFVFAVMGVMRGFFQGNHNMLPTSFSQILEQIVNAIVSIVAAYYLMKAHSASVNIEAYGAAGGTLGTLIGAITSLLFLGFVFWINRPIINKKIRKDHVSEKETYQNVFLILLFTIIPVILSQTVYQLSAVLDSSLFGHIMDGKGLNLDERRELLGIYSGKYNLLVNVPVSIASALAVAIVPSITSAYKNMAILDVKNKVSQSVKLNMIIAFPCTVGMAVLASPILRLLFAESRVLPANLIRFGAIAIIFYSLSTVTNAVLQGINMLRLPVFHSAISLAVHVVLVFILLQFFNLSTYGLVIGNITFALLVCVLNWRAVAKHLNYKQEINKSFIIPAICAVIMGIFTYVSYQGVYNLLHINSISTLFAICLSAIIYFVLLLLFKDISEAELYGMPKGRLLVRIAKKLHLL
jgi:stage V sporulation protein B